VRFVTLDMRQILGNLHKVCCFAVVAYVILLLPGAAFCQTAQEQVAQEIARLSKAADAMPKSDPTWKSLGPRVSSTLASARSSLEAGRLFRALEYLDNAQANLLGSKSLLAGPMVQKQGMTGFEAERSRVNVDLTTLEQRYDGGNWASRPVALRALAETDWNQTRVYFDSARAFATSMEPEDGLYYLGVAKALVSGAVFFQSLKLTENLPAPALRSIAPEIQQLEEKIIAIYKPPYSIEHHSDFIRIHSALKEGNDLERAHLYAGALYKYLDSLQMLAALEAPAPGPQQAVALHAKLAEARKRVNDGKSDHSIAEIFLQRVEGGLDPNQPKDDYAKGLTTASAVFDQVIPAYFAALEKVNMPAAAPKGAITVTLVRWPYT
jgi:hypothetical protein